MAEGINPHDPRLYLAAERTFLAWIRTGVALMGLGFVVARFGLFLRELEVTRGPQPQSSGLSVYFGTGLLVLGVAVNIASVFIHARQVKALNANEHIGRRPSKLGIAVSLVLSGIGIAMAIYVFFFR